MIQLFFFISMTAIAALLLNMFWYLDDSRREENEFRYNLKHRINPLNTPRCFSMQTGKSNGIHRDTVRYPNYKDQFSRYNGRSAYRTQVRFYEIGTSTEVPSFQSLEEDQTKSA